MPQSKLPIDATRILARLSQYAQITDLTHAHYYIPEIEERNLSSLFLHRIRRYSLDIEFALTQPTARMEQDRLLPVQERLNSFLLELELRDGSLEQQFTPTITRWVTVLDEYLSNMARDLEPDQQIDNPYVFGMPLVKQQEIFVGRTEVSMRIRRVLVDEIQLPALLYGQRRMGKTSLLKNLGRLLPENVIFFFIDGEGISVGRDYAALLYNMSREIIKSAKQRQLWLPALTRNDLKSDPFSRFNEWLDELEDVLRLEGYEKAVFALDEFEALDRVLDKGRFDERDMFRMLRYLIQHRDSIEVLLAGSHTIDELPRWANHMINVKTVKISYLKRETARRLIEHPVRNFVLRYEPSATQRILELTRSHPYLIQLMCYELVVLKNEQPAPRRYTATLADVEATISYALSKGSFFFVDIQKNQMPPTGAGLMCYLAQQGEGAVLTADQLAAQLDDQPFDPLLRILLHRDVVEPFQDGYRFQVELIRRWFAEIDQ